MEQAHRAVSWKFYLTNGMDPHITDPKTGEPAKDNELLLYLLNPFRLGALWFGQALKWLITEPALAVTRQGAILPLRCVEAFEAVQQDDWPSVETQEVCYVKKWPGGSHYYVTTRSRATFDKYNSPEEASEAIRSSFPNAVIRHVECKDVPFFYRKQGD